jgi:hypothetical protein
LLNDTAQDYCPYFLTANHCVGTQAAAQTVETIWFYQTTLCGGNTLRNWVWSPIGADLLRTQAANDFSLLRLRHDPPAGAVFAGWTSAAQSTGTYVFGLHHPGGYWPLPSPSPSCAPCSPSYLRRSTGSIANTNASCATTGLTDGYTIDWLSGVTEGGSSGSGLFRSNGHRLVGVLSCGSNTGCTNPFDHYSKFASFYPQIRSFIGSLAPAPPVAKSATFVTSHSFKANWMSVCGATGYRLDVSTNTSFNSYVTGYQNLNVGNVTNRSVTGLNAGTTYYYRVRAFNGNGTSVNSNRVHATTLGGATPTPSPGGCSLCAALECDCHCPCPACPTCP